MENKKNIMEKSQLKHIVCLWKLIVHVFHWFQFVRAGLSISKDTWRTICAEGSLKYFKANEELLCEDYCQTQRGLSKSLGVTKIRDFKMLLSNGIHPKVRKCCLNNLKRKKFCNKEVTYARNGPGANMPHQCQTWLSLTPSNAVYMVVEVAVV